MILSRISVILSFISLCIILVLNYIILNKNLSYSILGQYGDYSNLIFHFGNEKFIPLFIAFISLLLGLLNIKKAKKRIYFPIGLSIFTIILSMIPIWKLLFSWLKHY